MFYIVGALITQDLSRALYRSQSTGLPIREANTLSAALRYRANATLWPYGMVSTWGTAD